MENGNQLAIIIFALFLLGAGIISSLLYFTLHFLDDDEEIESIEAKIDEEHSINGLEVEPPKERTLLIQTTAEPRSVRDPSEAVKPDQGKVNQGQDIINEHEPLSWGHQEVKTSRPCGEMYNRLFRAKVEARRGPAPKLVFYL